MIATSGSPTAEGIFYGFCGTCKKANACAKYLTSRAKHLDYPTALAGGRPVASGIIKGTCRYLVAGVWGLDGQ